MSNTGITNIEVTDTFQVWLNKTNEIIDLANENVLLAGPGAGFTVQGNSTLQGSFTATNLTANTSTISSISTTEISRANNISANISVLSPINISGNVENLLTVQSSATNRPLFRLINGANSRWIIGQSNTSASSPLMIRTEGAAVSQLILSQSGRLTVTGQTADAGFEGNGSRITNINAANISSGVFGIDRIPNLDASKITSGAFNAARIPNLDASKITTGTFNTARIPNLDASKITSGIIANTRLPASATRTEITLANLISSSSATQGFITGRRFFTGVGRVTEINATNGGIGMYVLAIFLPNNVVGQRTVSYGQLVSGDQLVPATIGGNGGSILNGMVMWRTSDRDLLAGMPAFSTISNSGVRPFNGVWRSLGQSTSVAFPVGLWVRIG